MNYDTAKAICAEHAPQLDVGANTGMQHINVFQKDGTHPFSIHIPSGMPAGFEMPEGETVEQHEKKQFTDALDAAVKHFGG